MTMTSRADRFTASHRLHDPQPLFSIPSRASQILTTDVVPLLGRPANHSPSTAMLHVQHLHDRHIRMLTAHHLHYSWIHHVPTPPHHRLLDLLLNVSGISQELKMTTKNAREQRSLPSVIPRGYPAKPAMPVIPTTFYTAVTANFKTLRLLYDSIVLANIR